MPNCFNLTDKSTGQVVTLDEVDRALCKMLGVPVHETRFVEYWVDNIGLQIAMGKSWDSIKAAASESDEADQKIVDYLEEHYTARAWYEHKGAN
jgi:hypothetical protein